MREARSRAQPSLSSSSAIDVHPGSAGKSVLPSPSSSKPLLHWEARHVCEPGAPLHTLPSGHRSAPPSEFSQLAPVANVPKTLTTAVPKGVLLLHAST